MIRIMSDQSPAFEKELPASALSDRRLAAGELLFRQGDASFGFFRLLNGAVDMVRWTPSGAPLRLHAVRSGETFAEASLFAGHYHCDALATADSEIRSYACDQVLLAMETAPGLAIAMAAHLATSLRDARRLLELRSVTPLKLRLLFRLRDLAGADGRLPSTATITGIAAEIGATPEACYRAVAALERDGVLTRFKRGRIVLLPRR